MRAEGVVKSGGPAEDHEAVCGPDTAGETRTSFDRVEKQLMTIQDTDRVRKLSKGFFQRTCGCDACSSRAGSCKFSIQLQGVVLKNVCSWWISFLLSAIQEDIILGWPATSLVAARVLSNLIEQERIQRPDVRASSSHVALHKLKVTGSTYTYYRICTAVAR